MHNLTSTDTQLGLDTFFPGSDGYYKQSRLPYYPYVSWGMLTAWYPRDSRLTSIEQQRRSAPSSIEEACVYGSLPHVILFWAQGVDLKSRVALYEGSDATPLMWASLRGHLHIVKFLIDQGVNINASNSLGHNALLWALTGINYEMVHFLLEHGADPTLKDKQGYSAYFVAVQSGNLSLLLLICEFRSIDIKERDEEGHSLLHWAAYTNSPAICQYLVDKCHMEMDTKDKNGRTPLIWAAREGYSEVIEYLVGRGARTEVSDVDGYTALQYARFRNHREAIYVLLKHPASRRNGITASVEGESLQRRRSSWNGYTEIQETRRRGTISLMFHQPIFLFMSLLGIFYILLAHIVMKFIPPILSHIVFGIFFFRNSLWMLIVGHPIQGGKPELSSMQQLGIASSFGESVRGIWLFRNRDAACLFALISFLIIQQYAWAKMGLVPVLFYFQKDKVILKGNGHESIYESNEKNWWHTFFHNKAELEQAVVLMLFCLIFLNIILCKLLSMRSIYEPKIIPSLETSPIWGIIKQRAYQWLHPRILCVERHMLLPLRTFYCYERDVFMKRYDNYSISLDCPIAESNHVSFFIFVNCFACLQWLIFFWSWGQISELMQCPNDPSFNHWLFSSLWNLLIHALPCPDPNVFHFEEWGPLLSWLRFILPTPANSLGVWLLHFSFVAALFSSLVVGRQWAGVCRGATRLELANPTAPSSQGGLVRIFLSSLSNTSGGNSSNNNNNNCYWRPPAGVTEGLSSISVFTNNNNNNNNTGVGGEEEKKNTDERHGVTRRGPCIYANGSSSLGCLFAFMLGIAGRRWRGAMAISPSNTPVFNLPICEEGVQESSNNKEY